MTVKKTNKNIICENCDSEFKLSFARELVANLPQYCSFCGEELTHEEDEEQEDLDFNEDSESDY